MIGSLRALALLAALFLPAAAGAEAIRDFAVAIELEPSGRLAVQEDILYDFAGARRHGIYRDIPVRYERPVWDHGIDLEVERVTDENGRDRPFQVSRSGGNLRIRIGSPDRKVEGRQHYRIHYRVGGAVLFFEEHDELYWNATGTEWAVPIDRAAASVRLPTGANAGSERVRIGCATGPFGSRETACEATRRDAALHFEASRPLAAREGLTVAVTFPKGLVAEPGIWERWRARLAGGLWLLLPPLALGGMLHRWWNHGRDRGPRGSIPVRYEPPEGLTPAEVGTLVDERADLEDVTATILDLAVRGHLVIDEIETTKFLFLTERDYRLQRRNADESGLKAHEHEMLRGLFERGDVVEVSSLKNRFYRKLPKIQRQLYSGLSGRGRYFPAAPDKVQQRWVGLGVAGAVVGGVAAAHFAGFVPMVCAVVAGLIVAAFSRAMPRRTRRGRAAYEEVLGLQEFVRRVDADRLERMGGRTADTFERILPYAIVLGVADEWADAFAGIYTRPPEWYRSNRGLVDFRPGDFVSDVGRGLSTIGQTLSSTPRGSGGSGFSGGGGFSGSSGGGFGGGGGGSW